MDTLPTLHGLHVAVTGRLASMSHREAEEHLRRAGAVPVAEVDDRTDLLVVGRGGWPLTRDGEPTRALRAAEELAARGGGPRVVDERELLAALGLAGPELTAEYTTHQLARILEIPAAQLRAWVRAGLIRPARVVRRMWTFGFAEVASARSLCRLMREGASPTALARGLEQLERWLPDARRSLPQLATLERRGDLLVRTRSGRLVEPNGQLRLFAPVGAEPEAGGPDPMDAHPDAAAEPGRIAGAIAPGCTTDPVDEAADDEPGLIDAGLALERAGRVAEAVTVYRAALREEPECTELWFNLGNALYALARAEAACDALRRAVAIDPGFVEAWNNLGNAHAECGRSLEATDCWHRALALDPGCADAHFNLAEELLDRGELVEAQRHIQSCLCLLPPDAPEASHLQETLERLANANGAGAS